MRTKRPMTADQLRQRRSELALQLATHKHQALVIESEMLSIDRQLGEFRDQHPPSSGRDTTGVP